jgi:hypothetical protein
MDCFPDSISVYSERIICSRSNLIWYEMGRQGRVKGSRELLVSKTPFILPYRIRKNRIEILGVIHGNRRWPDLV